MPGARRGHKKSTVGCTSCKQKHVKCDETRPSCVNCNTQGRRCPYLDQDSDTLASASGTPLGPTSGSENTGIFSSNRSSLAHVTRPPILLDLPTPYFDLINIELLQQWLGETHRSYVFNDDHARIYGPVTFNLALAHPFLMHGILANAALQLSLKDSEQSVRMRRYSSQLLGQALSSFNQVLPKLDSNSIVAAFLFSSIMSAHHMCECFLSTTTNLDSFLAEFVNCMSISNGVNIVIHGWWGQLLESELRPILMVGLEMRAEKDVDRDTPEFDDLRRLIISLKDVNSPKVTETYQMSTKKLQWSWNAQCALDSPELNSSMSWAFAWPVNVTSDLMDLLRMKRPEALIILAHYCPILHRRRSSWGVGSAGSTIFTLIEAALGPTWADWMRWPREMVKSSQCLEERISDGHTE